MKPSPSNPQRAKAKWFLMVSALLAVWTVGNHLAWWHHRSILHGVPAFFLGLAVILIAQALARIATGAVKNGCAWLLSKAALQVAVWTLLFLAGTIALFYSVELWRGKRAWALMTQTATFRGETLRLEELVRSPVPDAENFARAGCFDELISLHATRTNRSLAGWAHAAHWEKWPEIRNFVQAPWLGQQFTDFGACLEFWRGWEAAAAAAPFADSAVHVEQPVRDLNEQQLAELVLRSLAPFETQIGQVRAASTRPHARFPLDYSRQMFEPNPFSTVLNGLTRILRVRASAALATGKTQQAFDDATLALRLCQLNADQPWPMADEQRLVAQIDALQPIWEGLAKKQWNEPQLIELQNNLQELAPLRGLPTSIRLASFGLAGFCEAIVPASKSYSEPLPVGDEQQARVLNIVRMAYPRGWSLQDQAAIHDDRIRVLHERFGTPSRSLHSSSDPFFSVFIVPRAVMMLRENLMFYMAQAAADLAATGCALERYQLKNGAYPKHLQDLVPAYLNNIPTDPITDRPMSYSPLDRGSYVLYFFGTNQTDDAGRGTTIGPDPAKRFLAGRIYGGDWVWKYGR